MSWAWDEEIVKNKIARLTNERDNMPLAKRRYELQVTIDRWKKRLRQIEERKSVAERSS